MDTGHRRGAHDDHVGLDKRSPQGALIDFAMLAIHGQKGEDVVLASGIGRSIDAMHLASGRHESYIPSVSQPYMMASSPKYSITYYKY